MCKRLILLRLANSYLVRSKDSAQDGRGAAPRYGYHFVRDREEGASTARLAMTTVPFGLVAKHQTYRLAESAATGAHDDE